MNVTATAALSLIKVVVVFTAVIGGLYGFVIPVFFPDYKTYSILIIGIGVSSLFGGHIGYQLLSTDVWWTKAFASLLSAIVVAVLVASLSLLIILNVRGS